MIAPYFGSVLTGRVAFSDACEWMLESMTEGDVCSGQLVNRYTADGWTDGWMDGWMDGRTDGWMTDEGQCKTRGT